MESRCDPWAASYLFLMYPSGFIGLKLTLTTFPETHSPSPQSCSSPGSESRLQLVEILLLGLSPFFSSIFRQRILGCTLLMKVWVRATPCISPVTDVSSLPVALSPHSPWRFLPPLCSALAVLVLSATKAGLVALLATKMNQEPIPPENYY